MSEPTKAAIERRKELTRDAMTALRLDYEHAIEHAFARQLDQVSETAKHVLNGGKVQALFSLTLPDPEPDVLAEVASEALRIARSGDQFTPADERLESALRQVLRGYAITKTGEAGQ